MIDVLNWFADHFIGTLIFIYVAGMVVEDIVRAARKR